ncbi:MAG: T9SS type A sorting domain-containing protein [Ignavibacteria bacterium]|nr:T9SS type A sorting domain-containing protein [Ignavibacteria bacterium]
MRYKSYPGYGHEIWDVAQGEPAWKDWMFAFSKNDTVYEKPTGIIELTGSVADNRVKLTWNDIRIDNQIADKIWYYKIYNKSGLISTTEFDKTIFEFPLTSYSDTFKVTGVNYQFQESEASNQVILDNGVILDVEESTDYTKYEFGIESIYPNPFNPSTIIKYKTPPQSSPLVKGRKQEGFVTLKVFNLLGQEVATLVNETQDAGKHEVKFTANDLSSGIYLVKISAGSFNQVKKIMLAK